MKSIISNKKAVVFDLDNTLYDEGEYFVLTLNDFCKKNQLESKYDALINAVQKYRSVSKNVFKDVLTEVELEFERYSDSLYESYVTVEASILLSNQVLEGIAALRARNLMVAVLTNGTVAAQKNKVKTLNLEGLVDFIVYARTWGAASEKPHQRPFDEVVSLLACNYEDVLFVGDKPLLDLKVPKENGASTIWVNGKGLSREGLPNCIDLEVRKIEEIFTLI